jgi:hypothetical protein
MKFIRTPRDFIIHLVDQAMWGRILKSRKDSAPYPANGKIGAVILNLDPDKTALIQDLKSDDVQNIRWPRY